MKKQLQSLLLTSAILAGGFAAGSTIPGESIFSNVSVSAATGSIFSITDPDDQTVYENEEYQFHAEKIFNGTAGTITAYTFSYKWQYSSDNGSTWKDCSSESASKSTLTGTALLGENGYLFRCSLKYRNRLLTSTPSKTSTFKTIYSKPAKLTVKTIVINQQPTSVSVKEDTVVTFKVQATGDNLRYQWQYSDNGTNWYNCSNGNSASISRTATLAINNRKYRCKIYSGTYVKTSNSAVLRVSPAVKITQNPYNTTVTEDATAKFTVKATGDNLTYQWQCSSDNGETWKDMLNSSAKEATLYFTAARSYTGVKYRCVVSSGKRSATSSEATLTVKPIITITEQPKSSVLYSLQTASFSVSATSIYSTSQDDIEYQWQKYDSGKWKDIPRAVNRTYSMVPYNNSSENNYQYFRCKITSGLKTVYSNYGTLTVKPHVKITTDAVDKNVSPDDYTTFSVNADGLNVRYVWEVKYTENGSWYYLTNETKPSYSVKITPQNESYQYKCKIYSATTGSYDNASEYKYSSTVKANVILDTPRISLDGLVYYWGEPSIYNQVIQNIRCINLQEGVTLRWERSVNNSSWGYLSSAAVPTINERNTKNGTNVAYRLTVSYGSQSKTSEPIRATVSDQPLNYGF